MTDGPRYSPRVIAVLTAVTYWRLPARIADELGEDSKFVANTLGRLVRDGLVRRVCHGVYAITPVGLEELARGDDA